MRLLILLALFLDSFNVANALTNVMPPKQPTTERAALQFVYLQRLPHLRQLRLNKAQNVNQTKLFLSRAWFYFSLIWRKCPKLGKSGDDVSITFPYGIKTQCFVPSIKPQRIRDRLTSGGQAFRLVVENKVDMSSFSGRTMDEKIADCMKKTET